MSKEFQASNGSTIRVDGHPFVLYNPNGIGTHHFSESEAQALREFFLHERDERLGRWRWPENPDYVVYPRGESAVHVFDEASGIGSGRLIFRDGDPSNPTAEYRAAYAYFDAHPEKKPWHDAKPGEVWVLDVTAGRRIWPEGDG